MACDGRRGLGVVSGGGGSGGNYGQSEDADGEFHYWVTSCGFGEQEVHPCTLKS